MANPLGIFLSRLAPEEKRFIKRIGILLFTLLIISIGALYFYTYYEQNKIGTLELANKTEPLADTLASEAADTSISHFDTDTIEHIEPPEIAPTAGSYASAKDDFDEQSHLQLMRLNASEYNYKMAYQHGMRITSYLSSNSELTAEWGHVLLEAGKPAEAVSALQKITSEDTVKSDVAINMAFAMFRSGNANGAIEFLDEKMKVVSDVNLLVAKAAIIGEHPDTTERKSAEPIFESALSTNSSLPSANYWYGVYLMRRGDYYNSKVHLERAANAKPNEPRYVARLGMAEFYLKQDSKAETLYKRALKINPYDYNTWYNLGELYLSEANESPHAGVVRQKTHLAMESYLNTIENDSLHANAHYRLGVILNGNSSYKEAIKHLNIALEKMPSDVSIMQQLSSAYIKLGDTTQSLNYLNEILQIDPFNKIAASELNRLRK